MNKKILIPLALLAVGGAVMLMPKKANNNQRNSSYEGRLLKPETYKYETLYIVGGVGYRIHTAEGWSGLNRKLYNEKGYGLDHVRDVVSDSIYESIQVVGRVDSDGNLINF